LDKIGDFARYRDVDGDGITYRTLPGTDHPKAAYLARGTGKDEHAIYSERPEDYERNMERLARKLETARGLLPQPLIEQSGNTIGLISFGSTDPAVQEARDRLEESGIQTDYMRLRAIPFPPQVSDFVHEHERVYVIEMNHHGQMHKLLQLEVPELATRMVSLKHNNGLPLSARWINAQVESQEGK
jgi:2-oxoglutarate ferredoxin oxidoreductase subunit alpha